MNQYSLTPKQRNALIYRLGETAIMEGIAKKKYLDALRAAYRSRGIPEKRKAYRNFQAQKAGLLAKLENSRK